MDEQQVMDKVKELLVCILAVPVDGIMPSSRIILDLGAESIDLLELRFGVEKTFGLKTSREDVLAMVGEATTAEQFQREFTVAALARYLSRALGEARG